MKKMFHKALLTFDFHHCPIGTAQNAELWLGSERSELHNYNHTRKYWNNTEDNFKDTDNTKST